MFLVRSFGLILYLITFIEFQILYMQNYRIISGLWNYRKRMVLTIQDQANLILELEIYQCESSSISTLCPDQTDLAGCQTNAQEFTRSFPFQLSLYSNFCPLHSSGLSKGCCRQPLRHLLWN